MLLVAAGWIEPDDEALPKYLAPNRRVVCTQHQIQILPVVHGPREQWVVLLDRHERPRPLAVVAIDGNIPIAPVTVDDLAFGREHDRHRRDQNHHRSTRQKTSHRTSRTLVGLWLESPSTGCLPERVARLRTLFRREHLRDS